MNVTKKSRRKPRLTTYLCTLQSGRVVELSAKQLMDVGELCFKKFKQYPIDVKKKPFEPKEQLTYRPFADLKSIFKDSVGKESK